MSLWYSECFKIGFSGRSKIIVPSSLKNPSPRCWWQYRAISAIARCFWTFEKRFQETKSWKGRIWWIHANGFYEVWSNRKWCYHYGRLSRNASTHYLGLRSCRQLSFSENHPIFCATLHWVVWGASDTSGKVDFISETFFRINTVNLYEVNLYEN